MTNNLYKLLHACTYFDYGLDTISLIEATLQHDSTFNLTKAREALLNALADDTFDWVSLAIDTQLVYTSTEMPPEKFATDELLIFTDRYEWNQINHADAQLSLKDKDCIKDLIRSTNLSNYRNSDELMRDVKFANLPFEVKHAYLVNFGTIQYSNEDIVYYLKSLVWPYLFPHEPDVARLESIGKIAHQHLAEYTQDDGWMDMHTLLLLLRDEYPDIDLFELSNVNWDKKVEHKNHYRNPFTLGFKRYQNLPK